MEQNMSDKELLNLVAENSLASGYVPEFANVKSPEHLREALGCAIAAWCSWGGTNIMEVFMSALEDANYHSQAGMVQDWIDELD